MEEKQIDTVALENGRFVKLYDASRPVAGDRWLVRLVARLPMGVDSAAADLSRAGIDPEAVRERLGSEVVFEYAAQRQFVDEKEKERVLTVQKDAFLETVAGYLGKTSFAARFIEKRYREAEEKARWVSENPG